MKTSAIKDQLFFKTVIAGVSFFRSRPRFRLTRQSGFGQKRVANKIRNNSRIAYFRLLAVLGLTVLVFGCSSHPIKVQVVEGKKFSAQELQQWALKTPALQTASPEKWPGDFPWRPRRHFGPIRSGSDLSQIQMLLHQRHTTWHFNDFFNTANAQEMAVYKLYYKPTQTAQWPQDYTPAMADIPGDSGTPAVVPATAGWANHVLLSFVEMGYSSRYGGSFELVFRLADVPPLSEDRSHIDDFEFEFGKRVSTTLSDGTTVSDDFLFDVSDLTMRVFVRPEKTLINPTQTQIWDRPVQIEFEARSVMAYKNLSPITLREGIDVLNDTLANLSAAIPSTDWPKVRSEATRFAHALFHNQYEAHISPGPPPDKVTTLRVSDDFADLITEATEPYIMVYFKIEHMYWREGDDEIDGWFHAEHFYEGGGSYIPGGRRKNIRVEQYGSSGWYFIGGFHLWECPLLDKIRVVVRVDSIDAITDLDLDCPLINAQAQQVTYASTVADAITGGDFRGDGLTFGIASFLSGGQGYGVVRWLARADVVPR
jgi:hypothetical protein